METPLKIHSEAELEANSDSYVYSGDFILKTVKKDCPKSISTFGELSCRVVQNEIGDNAPAEALKAQIVAARTRALNLLLTTNIKLMVTICAILLTAKCIEENIY